MLDANKKICLTGDEVIDVLKEINFILISLHQMGSYYADDYAANNTAEYEKETTKFIDDCKVTGRLAKVRSILSSKFDTSLGEDDMDDLERAMEDLQYWSKPSNYM